MEDTNYSLFFHLTIIFLFAALHKHGKIEEDFKSRVCKHDLITEYKISESKVKQLTMSMIQSQYDFKHTFLLRCASCWKFAVIVEIS